MKGVFLIFIFVQSVLGTHFRGGMISWRPASTAASVIGTKRTIIVDQRYTWSRSAPASSCTSTTITTYGLIGENVVSSLTCQSLASTCSAVGYSGISTYVPCTDYNTVLGMSFGHSSTAVNLTVKATGVVIGYAAGAAWLTLQMGAGGWSMMAYINMQPRSDNGIINSSPTSDIPPIIYVPAGANETKINIPMSDADGDDIECRFAKASNNLGGTTVNECSAVCETVALPSSTQLISGNNTCTLIVKLPSIGYYAVAVQIEDFLANTSTLLSSVPLQFLILSYDASNPTSSCTQKPIITSIPPDFPIPDDTITIQVGVLYQAMVIAKTGCENDTDGTISNFITTSPPGMLKTNLPFYLGSAGFAINLTWTPSNDQLGQTYTFCAVAVDSNFYSSDQYCFNIHVGPKTTTTTTTTSTSTSTTSSTSSTSTSSTSTTSTTTTSATTSTTSTTTTTSTTATTAPPYNPIPLILGLGLGLGLPLLLLLTCLALTYLCRWCPGPLRSVLRHRFGNRDDMYCLYCRRSVHFDDPRKSNEMKCRPLEAARCYQNLYVNNSERVTPSQYRAQYIRIQPDQTSNQSTTAFSDNESFLLNDSFFSRSTTPLASSKTTTFTSFHSPSTNSLPAVNISSELASNSSVLVDAYSRQNQRI
ncbi:unnamed protein product [Adineta ricciae]|uniref:Uncharacterized protein n=1 Tax=Adineta ricciae TaxID=249248 RepID=A0A815KWR2_ADIRI|nr:unnamed protein product [Adineta ricciae]CAF1398808.1 unnamed protein product [Adineta ricciae]